MIVGQQYVHRYTIFSNSIDCINLSKTVEFTVTAIFQYPVKSTGNKKVFYKNELVTLELVIRKVSFYKELVALMCSSA